MFRRVLARLGRAQRASSTYQAIIPTAMNAEGGTVPVSHRAIETQPVLQ
jgi:hypothetical protein